MLAVAMLAGGSRTAATVIALTTLVCVVAVAGNGPLRSDGTPEPYTPSRSALEQIGVVTSDYPIPGQLPPEVFPPEAWGLGPPRPPTWLLWALGAIGLAVAVAAGLRLARKLMAWRLEWRWRLPGRWRRCRAAAASRATTVIEPAAAAHEDDAQLARQAVDAALAPLSEPADPRTAVIEAYARMEHVLARRKLGRRTPEAPREYLARVLREQGMPEKSLTTLTALFEEARFSRHPIPKSAPRRAGSELQAMRVALAEATDRTETT